MPTPMPGQQTTLGSATGEAHTSTLTSKRAGWLIPTIAGVGLVGAIAIVLIISSGGDKGEDNRTAAAPAAGPAAPSNPAPTPTATVVQPEQITLTIKSKPTGADVYRAADGVKVGKTPYETSVPKGPGEAIFILKRRGYTDETVTMPTESNHSKLEIMKKRKRTSSKRTKAKANDTPPTKPLKTVEDPPKKRKRVKDGALDPFADPDEKSKDGAYKPFKN